MLNTILTSWSNVTKNVCEIFQNVFRQFLGDEAREGEDIFCGNIQSFVSTLKRQQRKNTVGNDKPDIHGILTNFFNFGYVKGFVY